MQTEDKNRSRSPISKSNKKWYHILDDYDIVDQIGNGAYGKVIKAKCKETGQFVAIKMIENMFDDPD